MTDKVSADLTGPELPPERSPEEPERVILAGVCSSSLNETVESLDELEELAVSAGAVPAGRLIQNLEHINPGSYLGSGKIRELQTLVWQTRADAVICDDELSPAQLGTLVEQLDCAVLDRTLLILDIFAQRAVTREGKIQVELAQLSYKLTHLSGLGKSLSRQGGGIGTRGPGEKKLESDRRRIRNRITALKRELAEVERHREVLRSARRDGAGFSAALVGYTNAGKSTLLNRLTGAGVYTMDRLFATLDPTTRSLSSPDGMEIMLTDTVGFIRKLPHHLIDAFKSTLEEALYADVIIHVVDSVNPRMEEQMQVVYETLDSLGITGKPILTAFNKTDLGPVPVRHTDPHADRCLNISAVTGERLEELVTALEEEACRDRILIERKYPYDQAGRVDLIRRYGRLLELEYLPESIRLRAYVSPKIYGQI